MGAKRKQAVKLKVTVNFTPVPDYQARLRKVLTLLLRPKINASTYRKEEWVSDIKYGERRA